MELFKAHHQWATRPADQRFSSLQELFDVTKSYASHAGEKLIPVKHLHTDVMGDDLVIQRTQNTPRKDKRVPQPATLTNWAFKQLCGKIGAPADYLGQLPAGVASKCINVGLDRYNPDGTRSDNFNLLFHVNGHLVCRAMTTEVYERVWNYEVAERLLHLQDKGWEPARPDFNADDNAKNQTALYASDHDMFAFVRLRNVTVDQPVKSKWGDKLPLYKGAIYWNSEVGASVLGVMFFYYNAMCGNHIIWGASEVHEIRLKHVGNVVNRFKEFELQLRKYANESVSDEQRILKAATTKRIAATKEQVLDTLFGMRLKATTNLGIARRDLEASYNAVLPEQDGDPRTVWGMAQGITRHSQTVKYMDQRTELDRGAGKLISMIDAF